MPDTVNTLTAKGVQLHAVAVKLPAFWPEGTQVWFTQAEAQFHLKGVTTSLTKFYHVLSALSQEVALSVRSIIKNPSPTTAYEDLKEALTKLHTPTRWELVDQLLDHPGLGDQRPSTLMTAMLAKLPEDHTACDLFLGLFLRRLPADVRAHLIAKDFSSPQEMAKFADKLMDANRSQQVAQLEMDNHGEVSAALDHGHRPQRRTTATPKSRSAAPNRPAGNEPVLCFYHRSFGSEARSCRSPCSFAGNGRAGGRR